MTVRLSPNFTLHELTRSQLAARLGIDNTPPPDVVASLTKLCVNVLQPVRDVFGASVDVSSGYRCPALNKAAKGSPTSQHVVGEAADIEIEGVSNLRLATYIRDNLDFDQVILEFPSKDNPAAGWVHVSYVEPGRNRKSVLTATRGANGKTVYRPGLIV